MGEGQHAQARRDLIAANGDIVAQILTQQSRRENMFSVSNMFKSTPNKIKRGTAGKVLQNMIEKQSESNENL